MVLKKKIKNKILRQELIRSILRPFISIPKDRKYFFVVGCYNSGTTLLADILSRHPLVSALPTEGAVLSDALKRPEDLGYTRMWVLCEREVSVDYQNEKAAIQMKKDWFLLWGRKKKYCLEKSIINTARILWLDKYFSPAYFIGIVRNGFAVCEGIRRRTLQSPNLDRRKFPAGYALDLCAKQWIRSNECLREAESKVSHFKLIQYEDLVADPSGTLKHLMEWLPIKDEFELPPEYQFKFQAESHPIRNFNEASIKNLKSADREKIIAVAKEELIRYGYF